MSATLLEPRMFARFILSIILFISISATSSLAQDRVSIYQETEEIVPHDELRILSWNIKMLPRLILRVRIGPIRRARLIPQKLIDDDIDLIVFQECFDVRTRRILKRRLKKEYPYSLGPANKKFLSIKTNSGIVIYSKYPIEHIDEIRFEQCDGPDCLARKGALLVDLEYQGKKLQIMGTHLEAGGTDSMKISQYIQIQEMLFEHEQDGVPQLLCGDFNTHKTDTFLYPKMLSIIDAEDGPLLDKFGYTSVGGNYNDLKEQKSHKMNKKTIIDYILQRKNSGPKFQLDRFVRIYKEPWSKHHKDLSDHYAVLGRFRWLDTK